MIENWSGRALALPMDINKAESINSPSAGRGFGHGLGKPFLGDLVRDGWSWLTSEGVEVNLNVLHYIERNTGS